MQEIRALLEGTDFAVRYGQWYSKVNDETLWVVNQEADDLQERWTAAQSKLQGEELEKARENYLRIRQQYIGASVTLAQQVEAGKALYEEFRQKHTQGVRLLKAWILGAMGSGEDLGPLVADLEKLKALFPELVAKHRVAQRLIVYNLPNPASAFDARDVSLRISGPVLGRTKRADEVQDLALLASEAASMPGDKSRIVDRVARYELPPFFKLENHNR